MKNLIFSTLLLLSLSSYSQFGIKGGINISSYTGGSRPYTGTKHAIVTPRVGLYEKVWLTKKVYLQPEIEFLMLGAKNSEEAPENFQTFHINLPVVIGIKKAGFSLQGGLYVNRMFYAKNRTWYGVNTFGWKVADWDYLDKWYYGGTAGLGYDFIGMELFVNYMHDFNKCQNIAWDYNVKKLGYNHALSITAYISLN